MRTTAAPVRLDELLDTEHLAHLVETRLVSCRRHPDAPLVIYDYTARASYARAWDNETRLCRGLIADLDGYVVARPFPKFFTLVEHQTDPLLGPPPTDVAFDVFEKLDGSLGILHDDGAAPAVATRGSFTSPQARWATEHYRLRYGSQLIPSGITYLFEIVYPGNRIIVDYGGFADLVLLAAIDNVTGADRPLPADWPGPVIGTRHGLDRLEDVAAAAGRAMGEGFVVRFAADGCPSLRVKVKVDEYVRLHRLLTSVTPRAVWEHLAQGRAVDDLVNGAPPAFSAWVLDTAASLRAGYARLEADCRATLAKVGVDRTDRRGIAAQLASDAKRAPIMFKMLDGRPYDQLVWRAIRPEGDETFRPDLDG